MSNCAEVSPTDIADALGVSESTLWKWVKDSKALYKQPQIRKVRGKERLIEAPLCNTKKPLKKLQKFLQKRCKCHRNAHGGVKGRSCFSGARKHLGRAYLVTRDVSDCYPNVSRSALKRSLIQLGFQPETARAVASLGTVRDQDGSHLPQGSPISPILLNLHLFSLDTKLATTLEPQGVRVHRVYDDIVASTNSEMAADNAEIEIEKAIREKGLKVNEKKRAKSGRQGRAQCQTVHNLVISNISGISITAKQRQCAHELGERYVRAAKSISSESIEAVATLRGKLTGYLTHFRQARFSNANDLEKKLKHGDRFVSKALSRYSLDRPRWYVKQRTKKGEIDRPKELAHLWRERVSRDAA